MHWNPELSIGWLNGWILLAFYLAVMFFQPLCYQNRRQIIRRLMFHPRDTMAVKRVMPITISLYYMMLILTIFLPIRSDRQLLLWGFCLFGTGMILYILAVHAFAITPLDQPVTKGVYRISRNPIHFFSWVAYYGVGLATGSWLIIAFNVLSGIGIHIGTLAEERFCLEKYGESYSEYIKRAPRYFLFF
ncbi:isoprenylcysteine carboxylmethyltransferase family protein [bacterium]|nr:isoprenylcysteine carboxylmethyltransferase family protein [bacterium]